MDKEFNIICKTFDEFIKVNEVLVSMGYNWLFYGFNNVSSIDTWGVVKRQYVRGRVVFIKNYQYNINDGGHKLMYDYFYDDIREDNTPIYGKVYMSGNFLRKYKLDKIGDASSVVTAD